MFTTSMGSFRAEASGGTVTIPLLLPSGEMPKTLLELQLIAARNCDKARAFGGMVAWGTTVTFGGDGATAALAAPAWTPRAAMPPPTNRLTTVAMTATNRDVHLMRYTTPRSSPPH